MIIAICGLGIILAAYGLRNAKEITVGILVIVAEIGLLIFSLAFDAMNIGIFLLIQALLYLTWSLWKTGRENYKMPFTK